MNNVFTSFARLSAIFMTVVISMTSAIGIAQTKVEIDENVRVQFLGDWRDGYVVDIDKKRILVEFEFAASTKRRFTQESSPGYPATQEQPADPCHLQ